jgi:GxxExxY protein
MGDFKHDPLTARILGCAFRVHTTLGPGFVESVYQRALIVDLQSEGLDVVVEKYIPIYYLNQPVGRHFLDVVIENRVIIEVKAVESICKGHYTQIRSYLKASNLKIGLIINFGGASLDYRRVDRRVER